MTAPPSEAQNRLLNSLPIPVRNRLYPMLEVFNVTAGSVIYDDGTNIQHVYFPTDSIVSLIYTMKNGATAGSCVIGNEGMVGIPVFMGGNNTLGQVVAVTNGINYRLTAKRFKDEFNHQDAQLRTLLLRYSQSLVTQIAQNTVCYRHHNIEQQLSRWLLMCLDRLPGNDIPMTQELIANILGVRREGITGAAQKLQKLSIIACHRGHIMVLDRSKLENTACECYSLVKNETNRLLPPCIHPGPPSQTRQAKQ